MENKAAMPTWNHSESVQLSAIFIKSQVLCASGPKSVADYGTFGPAVRAKKNELPTPFRMRGSSKGFGCFFTFLLLFRSFVKLFKVYLLIILSGKYLGTEEAYP